VAHFLPTLRQVVALKREQGQALAAGGFGTDAYDALLDEFEPGMTAAALDAMFGRMRPRLVALRAAVLGAAYQPAPLKGHFPREQQLALARELADAFGYDWSRGRLDLAVHPFSSGSGQDVRITTRVVESEPFNCFYSTIHEVGHALYELGIDPAHGLPDAPGARRVVGCAREPEPHLREPARPLPRIHRLVVPAHAGQLRSG
jgi:carboxypeptidase Taq